MKNSRRGRHIRLRKAVSRLAIVAALVLGGGTARLSAQGFTWTGLGGPLWSNGGNWGAGFPPLDGADVLFSGNPPNRANTLDYSLSLNSLLFSDDALVFDIHVGGAAGRTLTFTGPGIQNGNEVSASSPFLTAEAGAVGGTILFTGSSGINLAATSETFGVVVTGVPEPTTASLLCLSSVLVLAIRRRRARKR